MRKVAIIDDSEDVRSLWRAELERDRGFEVCAEGADGKEAIEIAGHYRPEVMLLDLAMPGMGGLEALPLILAASPSTQVVVLSGFGRREFSRTAGALGACGFVEKHLRAGSLPARLREALGDTSDGQSPEQPPILVIDPDRDDQELVRHLLEWLGYRADVAADGSIGVALAGTRRYAAVLLADQLPNLTAAEVAAQLQRRAGEHRPLPVIVMSGDLGRGRESWLAAGLTDHLSMPLVLSDLDAALARHAARPRREQPDEITDPGHDVDQEALSTLIGRIGPAAVASILEGFRVHAQDRLTHLQAAIGTGDAQEVTRLAHAIKGAAASVGALRMESISRELEFLAAAGSLDGSRDRVRQLRAAFDRWASAGVAAGPPGQV
ncbi:response regulator [Sporichthya sp.]|uniref:response regulator n=1 Tax=Sporichthya sp. TaxID=65475 RepID=UPI0017C47396|nr:response regulator [Sporichthya sp.]MBA3741717.1 response regulator [Sporichthya sp.]